MRKAKSIQCRSIPHSLASGSLRLLAQTAIFGPNQCGLKARRLSESKPCVPRFMRFSSNCRAWVQLTLRPGSPSTQVTNLSLPLGDLGGMAMSVSTAYALQHVDAGVAQIGTELTMSLDKPGEVSTMTIRGSGTGTGSMNYSIESKQINASRVHSQMTADIQMYDGTLRVESNSIYVTSSTEAGK